MAAGLETASEVRGVDFAQAHVGLARAGIFRGALDEALERRHGAKVALGLVEKTSVWSAEARSGPTTSRSILRALLRLFSH